MKSAVLLINKLLHDFFTFFRSKGVVLSSIVILELHETQDLPV